MVNIDLLANGSRGFDLTSMPVLCIYTNRVFLERNRQSSLRFTGRILIVFYKSVTARKSFIGMIY